MDPAGTPLCSTDCDGVAEASPLLLDALDERPCGDALRVAALTQGCIAAPAVPFGMEEVAFRGEAGDLLGEAGDLSGAAELLRLAAMARSCMEACNAVCRSRSAASASALPSTSRPITEFIWNGEMECVCPAPQSYMPKTRYLSKRNHPPR
jgi:hypothetical protein